MPSPKIFTQALSLILSVCLIPVPGISFASEINPENASAFLVSSVAIPSNLGSIQESFQGEKNQTVIYIQDAHTNYEAQSHISGILEYLTGTYDVNDVNTEGAEGPVDLTLFRALPFPEIKKEILDKDMHSGNTAGVEFFAMTSPRDITLFGVDDDSHYLKNVGQYASLARKKKMYSQAVTFFQKITENLKSVMYSKEARAVDRLIKKNNRNHIAMDFFVKELSRDAEEANVDLGDYPTVSELNAVMTTERSTSVGAHGCAPDESGDQCRRADSRPPLQAPGVRNDTEKPVHHAGDWPSRFFQPAVAEASGHSGDSEEGEVVKPFRLSAEELKASRADKEETIDVPEGIDAKKLFEELDELKEELLNAFSNNSESKELIRLDRYLELLMQGLDLKLTPDNVKLLRRLRKEFKEDYLRDYLTSLSRKHRLNEPALGKVLESGLDEFSKSILDFYETVEARDKIMVNNLKRLAKRENTVSILVAGGFHTAGVTGRLRKEKVSYVVIQPGISTSPNERSYQELMLKWGNLVSAQATVRTLIAQNVYHVSNPAIALNLEAASQRVLQPLLTEFAERVLASGKMTPEEFIRTLASNSGGKLFPLISPEGIAVFSLDSFYELLALAESIGANPDEILSRRAARFPLKTAATGFGAENSGRWRSEELDRLEAKGSASFNQRLEQIGESLRERKTAAIPFDYLKAIWALSTAEYRAEYENVSRSIDHSNFYNIREFLEDDLNLAVNLIGIEHKSTLEKLRNDQRILVHLDLPSTLVVDGYYIPRQKTGARTVEDEEKKPSERSLLEKVIARHDEPLARSLLELAELEGLANREKIDKEWYEQNKKLVSILRQFGQAQWKDVFNQAGYHEPFNLSRPLKPMGTFHSYKMPEAHERFVKNFVTIVGTLPPNFYANIKSLRRFGSLDVWPSPFIELLTIEYQRFRFQKIILAEAKKFRQMAAALAAPHYLGSAEQRRLEFSRRHKELVSFWHDEQDELPADLLFAEASLDAEYYRTPLSDLINDVLGIDVAKLIAEDRAARQETGDRSQRTEVGEQKTADEPIEQEFAAALRAIPYDSALQKALMRLSRVPVLFNKSARRLKLEHQRALELLLKAGIDIPIEYRAPKITEYFLPVAVYVPENRQEALLVFVRDELDRSRKQYEAGAGYARAYEEAKVSKQVEPEGAVPIGEETREMGKVPKASRIGKMWMGLVGSVQAWFNRPSTKPFLIGKPTEADFKAVERPRLLETAVQPAAARVVQAPAEIQLPTTGVQEIGLPLSRERQERVEPFRDVTREEVDKAVKTLSELDASLLHNDAWVTFREIYETFNPEVLDDSLLSQPQIRKLVESIFENLRTLSNATQAPKTPSEASKLKRRLDYLRNLLAMLNDREPARIIELADTKEEAPPELRAEAGFGAAAKARLTKQDIGEIKLAVLDAHAHTGAPTDLADQFILSALEALSKRTVLTGGDIKEILTTIAKHAGRHTFEAYRSLPSSALEALSKRTDLTGGDIKEIFIDIFTTIPKHAEINIPEAYQSLPFALKALSKRKDLTGRDIREILTTITKHAGRYTYEAYRSLPSALRALSKRMDFSGREPYRIIFTSPFILPILLRPDIFLNYLSTDTSIPFDRRFKEALESIGTRLTLGGKVRFGEGKELLTPDLNEGALAEEIIQLKDTQKNGIPPSELQIAVAGIQSQRARMIALGFFIASTDHNNFEGIMKSPGRDPNSPKGILILGQVVEAPFAFTETPFARMDYLIPYPKGEFQDKAKLVPLIRFVRNLSYGLYLAEVLQQGKREALNSKEIAIANVYIRYERELVRLLRKYDEYTNETSLVNARNKIDHQKRLKAIRNHKLEQALWPQRKWLVDLDTYTGENKDWNELVPYLRRVEFTLLDQEPFEDTDIPVARKFLFDIRNLVFESADEIQRIQDGKVTVDENLTLLQGVDPLIDSEDPTSTALYARQVAEDIKAGKLSPQVIPDLKAIEYHAETNLSGFGIAQTVERPVPETEKQILTASNPTTPRREPVKMPIPERVPRRPRPERAPSKPLPQPKPQPLPATPTPQREPVTVPAGFDTTVTPAQRAARNYVWKFPLETARAVGFDDESVAADYLAHAIATNPMAKRLKQFEVSRDRLIERLSKGDNVFGPGGGKILNKLLSIGDEQIRKIILEKHWAVLQNQSYPNRLNQLPALVAEQILADQATLNDRFLSADSSAATLKKQLENIGFYGVPLNYLLDAREELGNFINSLSPEQQAKFSSEVTAIQAYITNYLIASKAISIAA